MIDARQLLPRLPRLRKLLLYVLVEDSRELCPAVYVSNGWRDAAAAAEIIEELAICDLGPEGDDEDEAGGDLMWFEAGGGDGGGGGQQGGGGGGGGGQQGGNGGGGGGEGRQPAAQPLAFPRLRALHATGPYQGMLPADLAGAFPSLTRAIFGDTVSG